MTSNLRWLEFFMNHSFLIKKQNTKIFFTKLFVIDSSFLGQYGHSLHFWQWTTHKKIQTLDLGNEGAIPLVTRFLHDPEAETGYVGCALSSAVFRFFKTSVIFSQI